MLIMICYIVPWWPSWLSDQIAFSNPESDIVWRVSRLLPWLPSWILELNDVAILNLHVTPMPPISSIWLTVWEEMWFEKFQDGHHNSYMYLGYWNRTILAILNFHTTPMPPIKFKLNQTYLWEQMWFEDFQDGCHCGHLGYQNRTILAVLYLHAAQMPSTEFSRHPTYCSGADNH